MRAQAFLAAALVCCLSRAAFPDITVTAGNWTVDPVANQATDVITQNPIAIMVSNDRNVGLGIQGVTLVISIGDKTSTPPDQPIIQAVDLVGPGTIFHGNNTGQGGAYFPPRPVGGRFDHDQ